MQNPQSLAQNRRGITVLALLLLIIALVILAFFLIRYLRTGGGPEVEVRTESLREPVPSHRARGRRAPEAIPHWAAGSPRGRSLA